MSSAFAQIEKLNDENYSTWCVQMRSVLIHQELWPYVGGDLVTKPTVEAEEIAWIAKDQKALATIILCVDSSQINYIKDCPTAKAAWDALKSVFQPKGPVRKVSIFRQLLNMKMTESENVAAYIRRFTDTVEKLKQAEINLEKDSPEILGIILLSSLPSSFENFIVAMESRDELPKLDFLKAKILEEGQRREGDAICGSAEPEHSLYLNRKMKRAKSRDRKNLKCFECGKKGHFAADCRQRGAKTKVQYSNKNQSNYKCSAVSLSMSPLLNEHVWVLDSGCTSHMCCDKSLFTEMRAHKERIDLVADMSITTSGIGKVVLHTEYCKLTLCNVLYAPELNTNFFSVSKATEKKFKVMFTKQSAVIRDKNDVIIFVAKSKKGLYIYNRNIECKQKIMCAQSVNLNSDIAKWHARFGHLNVASIIFMKNRNMVHGLKLKDTKTVENNCEICAKCKISSKPFKTNSGIRSKSVLELIHTDICGPMRVGSNTGKKYFILFVDDYSRKNFVYFIKNKSEAFNVFKEFKANVELSTGKKIKVLRSDNGREYLSNAFSTFLSENGIQHDLTAPYTPQQNGVAERANRTLVEAARCMLLNSNLPENFWAEAVNTAVYLRNRSPSKLLGSKTPYEMWHKSRPTVSHLRVFGSKVIVLDKSGAGKSKFRPKGKEMFLVGYCEDTRTYRLCDRRTNSIHRSRDVIFIGEEIKPNWRSEVIIEKQKGDMQLVPLLETIEYEDNEIRKSSEESKDDVDNCDDDEIISEEEIREEATREEATPKRKPGRPIFLRTGKRGRPKKKYCMNARNRSEIVIPATVEEALTSEDAINWQEAMEAEFKSLVDKGTWKLVDLPKGRRTIKNKWVFSIKSDISGQIEKFKARLVAKGCSQMPGIDYKETFSPVARYSTIRLLLALASEFELYVHQIDVVTAYLNGDLMDEIYMEQPKPFIDKSQEGKVCKLQKALYGLKQSGREWNKKIDEILSDIGFDKCEADSCVYIRNYKGEINIIVVYVDDILIASSRLETLKKIKHEIGLRIEIIDKGPVEHFLGMEVKRQGDTGEIRLQQRQFIEDLLITMGMNTCKKVKTPLDPGMKIIKCDDKNCKKMVDEKRYQSIIGSLNYLAICTRPDIAYSVCKLSQVCTHPHLEHFRALQHLLRYLSNTIDVQIIYRKTGQPLCGFADADCVDDRKSFTGYVFRLADASISWCSKKQQTVAMSTTEAEYMAMCAASLEAVYLRGLMQEMGFADFIKAPTVIFGDNQSAQRLIQNPVFHNRSKHIDVRFHKIRELYRDKTIDIKYVESAGMVADVLTKSLQATKQCKAREMLGLSVKN